MESIRFLREITCLLACQPRNLDCQVQSALECLCSAVGALATGIFWPDAAGRLRPRGQHPDDFAVAGDLLSVSADGDQPHTFAWSAAQLSGLAASMRVGGDALGLGHGCRRQQVVEIEAADERCFDCFSAPGQG